MKTIETIKLNLTQKVNVRGTRMVDGQQVPAQAEMSFADILLQSLQRSQNFTTALAYKPILEKLNTEDDVKEFTLDEFGIIRQHFLHLPTTTKIILESMISELNPGFSIQEYEAGLKR